MHPGHAKLGPDPHCWPGGAGGLRSPGDAGGLRSPGGGPRLPPKTPAPQSSPGSTPANDAPPGGHAPPSGATGLGPPLFLSSGGTLARGPPVAALLSLPWIPWMPALPPLPVPAVRAAPLPVPAVRAPHPQLAARAASPTAPQPPATDHRVRPLSPPPGMSRGLAPVPLSPPPGMARGAPSVDAPLGAAEALCALAAGAPAPFRCVIPPRARSGGPPSAEALRAAHREAAAAHSAAARRAAQLGRRAALLRSASRAAGQPAAPLVAPAGTP